MIATAALATAAGFLVLLLSPIPMVRGFGAAAGASGSRSRFVLALTAGLARCSSLTPAGSGEPACRAGGLAARPAPRSDARRPAGRDRRRRGWAARARGRSPSRSRAPGRVLAVGARPRGRRLGRGHRTEVISDIRELVPAQPARAPGRRRARGDDRRLGRGRRDRRRADDLTDPAVIAWMSDFEQRVLAAHGFGGEAPSCPSRTPSSARRSSLSDLFAGRAGRPTQQRIARLLDAAARRTSRRRSSIATPTTGDRRHGADPFGIQVMPLDEQKELIDDIRAQIDPPGTENDPPDGRRAPRSSACRCSPPTRTRRSSGSRYLADRSPACSPSRWSCWPSTARSRRALVPLIPIVLATGWSALVLWRRWASRSTRCRRRSARS